MSQLRIYLFEKLSVRCDGHEMNYFKSKKVQELFCYLLVYKNQAHYRGILADQLWGDLKIKNTKAYLRKSLWQLQSSLNLTSERFAEKILRVDSEWIEIDLSDCCWLDIDQFEEAYKLVRDVQGSDLDHQKFNALKSAVDLYKGDLLIGWYQDWCIFERERLKEMLIRIVSKLMGFCEANLDFETGKDYGDMLLRFNRAHERTHRRLMRMHFLAGNRDAALRQFDKCKNALREELSVHPSKRTYQLYNQIKMEDRELLLPRGYDQPNSNPYSYPSIDWVVNSLHRIKKRVGKQVSDQKELYEEMQALEDTIKMQY